MQTSLIWSLHYTVDHWLHCQCVSELTGLYQASKGWTGNYCYRDQATSMHFQRERCQIETSRKKKAVFPLKEEKKNSLVSATVVAGDRLGDHWSLIHEGTGVQRKVYLKDLAHAESICMSIAIYSLLEKFCICPWHPAPFGDVSSECKGYSYHRWRG